MTRRAMSSVATVGLFVSLGLWSIDGPFREPRVVPPWRIEFIEQAFAHSPTVRAIRRSSHSIEFYIEQEASDFIEIAVGFDVEAAEDVHRFDRWGTLRLLRDGSVAILGTVNLEDHWTFEYRP